MEARKITVVQTKNQKKSVIMSAATTLAELKSDLRANGIDYDGMTFFEGTSKVELKNDASVLPHDVPYKGTVTNELVFMLTNTNKKIRSGAMSRVECYNILKKDKNLQEACKTKYGRNYTQVPTNDLITLIEKSTKELPKTEAPKATKKEEKPVKEEPKKEETKEAPTKENTECVDNVARAAISRLVEILEENGTIEEHEKEEVLDILGGEVAVTTSASEEYKPKSASPYSDDEIDDMFAGMGVK